MTRTLLRGGCVLTLGTRTSNLASGDVLMSEGRIAEIGTDLRSRDAEVIDVAGAIVMPGFVDAHRHTWTSLFRNLGQTSVPESADAAAMEPDDVYAATLVGLLGAIEAGITTVADWFDCPSQRDGVAEAALQAHADAGLRTVFVETNRRTPDRLEAMLRAADGSAGALTTVALGLDAFAEPEAVAQGCGVARASSHRVHLHAAPRGARAGAIAELARRGLLGSDSTVVHWAGLDAADLDAIASSDAGMALSPAGEMAGGFGLPPVQSLIDRDIRPGLGVGHEWLAPGDAFAQMRAIISVQHATVFDLKLAGKGSLPKMMTTRDVIRSATSDGARSLGIADITGSLEVGRAADVLVLRTDGPNIFPINDPIGAVVWGMDTSDVAWVFAGGRALVRDGESVADVTRARSLASTAHGRLMPAAAGVSR